MFAKHQVLTTTHAAAFAGFILGLLALFHVYTLFKQGWQLFIVTSGSMQPALAVGDLLVSQRQASYYPGDVICYRRFAPYPQLREPRASMVTHRIIRAKHLSTQPQYLTKGDANQDPDPQWVKKQQVVGRVTAVVPYLGYAILFTRSQPGFYLLVALPATLLSWDLITNIIASFY